MQDAVVQAVAERPTTNTLVLLGDALDLDFGTLTGAIEGHSHGSDHRLGLRALLAAVCHRTAINRVVYVPGNHDYLIWDSEAQQRNVFSQLAQGKKLEGDFLMADSFPDPYVAGAMPDGRRGDLSLVYPHHVMEIGQHTVLLTHGHHLEKVQCGGTRLSDIVRHTDSEAFLKELAASMARYQTMARAIAIDRRWRRTFHQGYWLVTPLYDGVCDFIRAIRGMRGHPPSKGTFADVDLYLRFIAPEAKATAVVYGHSHRPGGWLPGQYPVSVPVYNCGSFVPPKTAEASMLFLGAGEKSPTVEMVSFSRAGTATSTMLPSVS